MDDKEKLAKAVQDYFKFLHDIVQRTFGKGKKKKKGNHLIHLLNLPKDGKKRKDFFKQVLELWKKQRTKD